MRRPTPAPLDSTADLDQMVLVGAAQTTALRAQVGKKRGVGKKNKGKGRETLMGEKVTLRDGDTDEKIVPDR